ncbi:hypothetical protein LX15_000844 [Streptoalloteichus tenebrarius]|uniref:DUF1989 domain-containing protein n=1 Tax=Streptoalloteichus tenebrarius (strain ATCC 17920 / DSM 40477 / JCM 4838 / CBS 697.72 / NBRC 16177 / NCIMB 11028 / NRRL B-12390 / A12253. 1 / ISP 5477) TaxID=1933 RepID=A0ABT1HNS7_STRSD|nr:urea carboxylase-associated family protein [Streptoalloteichus tenebrarius]MCP2257159.1 hypothetical protein [Streptoalloteichus tenebrarius]BFE98794.1 urea carboxylase-associated family protein [Streptoalloteichus tenebrarius]
MSAPVHVVPARSGRAVRLAAGAVLDVITPTGDQVVDTWALCPPDLDEHLSMEHTRTALGRLSARPGDALVSNRRRPLLTLLEDTSPGVHDTLIAACDAERYRLLGCVGHHDNCHDNFHRALREIDLAPPSALPAPLNLFMNVPWSQDGELSFEAPPARPGDHVRFRAEVDLVVVLSACPQDVLPVNGRQLTPTEVHYRVTAG